MFREIVNVRPIGAIFRMSVLMVLMVLIAPDALDSGELSLLSPDPSFELEKCDDHQH